MKWIPIEKFDKNDGSVFLFWDRVWEVGSFDQHYHYFTLKDGTEIFPTHFMPLPEGPAK